MTMKGIFGEVYECNFQQDLVRTKEGVSYDLGKNEYHILLAKGLMDGENPSYHNYGNQNRRAFSKVSFGAAEATENETEKEPEVVSDDEMADHDNHDGHSHSHDEHSSSSAFAFSALIALVTLNQLL